MTVRAGVRGVLLAVALVATPGCSLLDVVPEDDAGDVAWMLEALPAAMGRPLRGQDEVDALGELLDAFDRTALIEAATRDESYLDYWTEVMVDVLRVDRDGGLGAEADCYREAELDPSYYPLLVEHLRQDAPDDTQRSADWCGSTSCPPFTMRDVIRASLDQDRLDAMMVGYLIPFNSHAQAVSGRDGTLTTRFFKTMLDREVDCMACHTSTYSVTDALGPEPEVEWDRFEAAYRGSDGGTIDIEGAALSVYHQNGTSFQYGGMGGQDHRIETFFRDDQLVADGGTPSYVPWGMDEACTALTGHVAGYQASGSALALDGDPFTVGYAGIAGQVVSQDRDLNDLVATVQLGMDQIAGFGLSVPTETSESDAFTASAASGWRVFGEEYFQDCASCHTNESTLMDLIVSRPAHVISEILTSGAGSMDNLCQMQKTLGDSTDGFWAHGANQVQDGSCYEDDTGSGGWAAPIQVAYALRLYADDMLAAMSVPFPDISVDISGSSYVMNSQGDVYPVGTDVGHSFVEADVEGTRSGALAIMFANTLVNRVLEEIAGESMVLDHGFPRNASQARVLEELTGVFVQQDWSMRSLLGNILVASQMVGRKLPDRTTLDPYVLPDIINPWSAADPYATYTDDLMCNVASQLDAANCVTCHGAQFGSPDSADAWRDALLDIDGLVTPGSPDASLLVTMLGDGSGYSAGMQAALAVLDEDDVRTWIEEGAQPAAVDCDSGAPRSSMGNDRGDLVHARSLAQLQQYVHQVLGWPAPSAFGSPQDGVTWPLSIAQQDGMGRYTNGTQPGRKQLAVDTMVAWNAVMGTCAKPAWVRRGDVPDALVDASMLGASDDTLLEPSDWQDWIDVWVDELASRNQFGQSVQHRTAFLMLRERVLGPGSMVSGEADALGDMVGGSLTSPIWSPTRPTLASTFRIKRHLRNYCGALMTSPQVMLQGMSRPPMFSLFFHRPVGVCFLDEPCTESEHQDAWESALEDVGYDMGPTLPGFPFP